jgi:hypothetical protein
MAVFGVGAVGFGRPRGGSSLIGGGSLWLHTGTIH